MSTEFVTSPKSGVLASIASHYLFKGYRVCFTFDAIKQDSTADRALVGSMSKEGFRTELLRGSVKYRMYQQHEETAQALENKLAAVDIPWYTPDTPRAAREMFKSRLRDLVSHLKKMVSGKEAETPKSAQS